LTAAIRTVVPAHVRIVDSAATAAAAVRRQLPSSAPTAGGGRVTWLATDGAERFARVGSTFFGQTLLADAVQIIDL
jgi:glutamate racemase